MVNKKGGPRAALMYCQAEGLMRFLARLCRCVGRRYHQVHLATLDRLTGNAVMRLHVREVVTAPRFVPVRLLHDIGDIDDAGVFPVLGQEGRSAGSETVAIGFEDLHRLAGDRVELPGLGDVGGVARVSQENLPR